MCLHVSPVADAQPNAGDTSETGLLARIKALSADGIYTTLIGAALRFALMGGVGD